MFNEKTGLRVQKVVTPELPQMHRGAFDAKKDFESRKVLDDVVLNSLISRLFGTAYSGFQNTIGNVKNAAPGVFEKYKQAPQYMTLWGNAMATLGQYYHKEQIGEFITLAKRMEHVDRDAMLALWSDKLYSSDVCVAWLREYLPSNWKSVGTWTSHIQRCLQTTAYLSKMQFPQLQHPRTQDVFENEFGWDDAAKRFVRHQMEQSIVAKEWQYIAERAAYIAEFDPEWLIEAIIPRFQRGDLETTFRKHLELLASDGNWGDYFDMAVDLEAISKAVDSQQHSPHPTLPPTPRSI